MSVKGEVEEVDRGPKEKHREESWGDASEAKNLRATTDVIPIIACTKGKARVREKTHN